MNLFSRLLPIALLSLAAATPLAARYSDDGDDAAPPAISCPGCLFHNNSSPANPGPGPNVCNTELKVTVFGLSGACERAAAGAACLPALNCWSLVSVDYKSDCKVKLDRYPSGSGVPDQSIPGDPSTGWKMIFADFKSTVCGSPAELGYYSLTDGAGFTITNSYNYYCASCDE